jgi:DNA-binding response OmpR family regulator
VDGLHLAREGGYDAVVLDVMLPGLSGYQVCERLRADCNWVPVLILSAKDGEYDQADGLDLGADDYMTGRRRRGTYTPTRCGWPG